MDEIIQASNGDAVLMTKSKTLVTVDKTLPTPKIKQIFSAYGLAIWGDNNLYPQEVEEDIRNTPVLSSALSWLSNAIISGGLVYGDLTINPETGEDKLIRANDPGVNKFLRDNLVFTEYLPSASKQYFTHFNIFPGIVLNKDRSLITTLKNYPSAWCRLAVQDNETRIIPSVHINAQWERAGGLVDPTTEAITLLEKSFMPVESLRLRKDSQAYIYRVAGPGLSEAYYPRAPWHSVRDSKWLKIALDIPEFKSAMMKNQMTLKYHIRIPSYYFEWKYEGQWDSFDGPTKKKKKEAEYKLIDDCLSGASNAGKSIWSGFKYDENIQKEFPGISIERLDDKVQTGAYLEDSQEANSHILYALGFDGTLIGSTPAKSLGAGSGSDKREAWNILMTVSKPIQDKILEVLQFISDYNGWGNGAEPYTFWFKNYYIQTLNDVTPKKRNSTAE